MTELEQQQVQWFLISNAMYMSVWLIVLCISSVIAIDGYCIFREEARVAAQLNKNRDIAPRMSVRLFFGSIASVVSFVAVVVFGNNVLMAICTPMVAAQNSY